MSEMKLKKSHCVPSHTVKEEKKIGSLNSLFSLKPLAILLSGLAVTPAMAEEGKTISNTEDKIERLEQVTIIGTKEDANREAGSAYVLNDADLEKFSYTDINQSLREVPGVYLRIEDGFGLKPNIGIRGAVGERNNKITVMEDGILIAPAPYSGPSAYYFPTAGRLNKIEVLKGPSLVAYGPFTVGGAVNLVSTPIPNQSEGKLLAEYGSFNEARAHLWYGASYEQFGYVLETYQARSDGFQDIDRSNKNSGYVNSDYLAKFRWNTDASATYYQQLDFKLAYASEDADLSYLGLTDVDFDRDPNRRYGLTVRDNITSDHETAVVSHLIEFSDDLALSTDLYYNRYHRDWYKVDKIQGEDISAYIDEANRNNANNIGVLHGTTDANDIEIKHNDRTYNSYGLQSVFTLSGETGSITHDVRTGLRLHSDEVDRYQPYDVFDQQNGYLVYQSTEAPNASNNRVQTADALALFVMDTLGLTDTVDLTLGLRLEHYRLEQRAYNDKARNDLEEKTSSSVTEWLPSAGVTWAITDQWQMLGGYHRGTAVAEASSDPESADNFELGFRFNDADLSASAIGFYSNYSNAVQNCSVNNPCQVPGQPDKDSGSISLGSGLVTGLELLVSYAPAITSQIDMPMTLSYTYTYGDITKGSADGATQKGDVFANIPENMAFASIGFSQDRVWETYLNLAYTGQTCPNTTCDRDTSDRSLSTDELFVMDLIGTYYFTRDVSTYLRVENLANERAIVSRQPAGARPNKPRAAYVGVKWQF